MLTITHTHSEGTMIEGTSKGDGAGPILKARGWRWGRSITAWYIPHSRDRRPKQATITATSQALREAGWQVTEEIDHTVRSTAEVEADKLARQEQRVAGLAAKAQRKTDAAEEAYARHLRDVETLPPAGEPIKVGHHSEARHRRDLDRAHASMRHQLQASEAAETAEERAHAANITTARRYAPVTVANRIEKITAEIRKINRHLEGHRRTLPGGGVETTSPATGAQRAALQDRMAEQEDALAYWQQIRNQQIGAGTATNYGPETVSKGDVVKVGGQWHRVKRANAKTVSVEVVLRPETGYAVTHRAPWARVQDHRQA